MPDTAANSAQDWKTTLDAAFDWWRDAGVDCHFIDDPQDWLAHARAQEEAKAAAPRPLRLEPDVREVAKAPSVADTRAEWPGTLAEFTPWWLAEPKLAPTGLKRHAPTGPQDARLMILVPMPADDDGDGLLTGRTGRLLDGMLGAMGLRRAETYLASALPARIAMPDWEALRTTGLGDVLLHHVALAAPQKLLILGQTGISTLLGHDLPNMAQNLQPLNHEGTSIPATSAYDLEAMLARPALKAGLWSRWLDWTGN